MATVDDLIVQIKQYFNRPQWFDGSGADVTATVLPLFVNQAVHILERNLVTPFQTFSYQLTLAPNVQQYLLIPSGTPAVSYRSTRGITIPFQSGLASGIGARVFLQPHVQAREKWQLQKQVTANLQNTGPPVDYSVYWAPTLTPAQPGYWFWPMPDKPYVLNIDQLQWMPDLVAAQGPPQANWFTQNLPDLVLWEALKIAAFFLEDQKKYDRAKAARDEAWKTAQASVADLAFDEEGAAAAMVEPG